MTLAYEAGDTFAHRLDPRSKLAFQAGFAIAAFTWNEPIAPAVLTLVVALALGVARIGPVTAIADYRLPLVLLAVSPVVEGVQIGDPWFDVGAAGAATIASYRVVLVLAVSSVYVKTTPVFATQSAIAHIVPGRVGRFLSAGVAFVLRFLPLLQADLRRIRDASRARLGDQRSLSERMRIVATGGLRRAFDRADAFALALQARCFAWNPTLPPLAFERRDSVVLATSLLLAVSPVI